MTETTTCAECGEVVIDALVEPEARPARFNARASKLFRIVQVTKSANGSIAVPTEVHDLHSSTCKAVQR